MKRFFILFLFTIISFSVFSQSLDELDGYDWVTMSAQQKAYFLQGYLSSCITVYYMTYETAKAKGTSEENLTLLVQDLSNKLIYEQNIGQLIEIIDDYFSSPTNRKFLIYRTIPFLTGKEWWNRKTGVIGS